MSVEIKIIAADADHLAEQLLKVIKALGISVAVTAPMPPPEEGLDDLAARTQAKLAEQGFEMTITERPPDFPEDDYLEKHVPAKPAKPQAKKTPAPSMDKETAAKQLRGAAQTKGSSKSNGEIPPGVEKAQGREKDAALEDKKFVENFLTTRYHDTTLTLAERARASEFSLKEKARHNDVGLRQLPVEAFPAIRKRMEQEFGLT